jgi:hypothetical protein
MERAVRYAGTTIVVEETGGARGEEVARATDTIGSSCPVGRIEAGGTGPSTPLGTTGAEVTQWATRQATQGLAWVGLVLGVSASDSPVPHPTRSWLWNEPASPTETKHATRRAASTRPPRKLRCCLMAGSE